VVSMLALAGLVIMLSSFACVWRQG
jgi:hypothetical protein